MSFKSIAADLTGVAAIVAGAVWVSLDVKADTHVDHSTAIGALALATFGGWLIDPAKTRAFFVFLGEQAKTLGAALRDVLAGSASEK